MNLSRSAVEPLCSYLRAFPNRLVSLGLSACNLGDDGVTQLVHAIIGSRSVLRKLELSANGISDKGAVAVAALTTSTIAP